MAGLSGALGTLAGVAGTVRGALAGLTLSGVVGSVTGAISGFVTWLAAGSAGALAFAGALGAAIGLAGVWVLEVTGALDAVRGFGRYVGGELPASVRDGLIAVTTIFTGGLPIIGSFITGTIEGGFDEGFARAREATQLFKGAFDRSMNRIGSTVDRFRAGVVSDFNNLKRGAIAEVTSLRNRASTMVGNLGDDIRSFADGATGYVERKFDQLGSAVVGTVKQAWNTNIPSRLSFPSATIAGRTVGGGGIDIPRLQVGGMVDETGIAVVHEGEAVIPEPLTSAASRGGGGGGGGGDVIVERVNVTLDGDFDPTDMSRRDLEDFADKVASAIGKKTGRQAGVR